MERRVAVAAVAVGVLLGLAVVAAAAWHDLSGARTELADARSLLDGVTSQVTGTETSQGRQEAQDKITEALTHIAAARRKVAGSPFVAVTRVVPLLATQRSGVLRLIDDSRAGALVGRRMLDRLNGLAARTKISGGVVSLDALNELESTAADAGRQLGVLARSPSGLWGSLHSARQQFDRVAREGSARLLGGADGLRAARTMLGADGPRRYLVAVQNNAEMRDQGMVLSYAVANASGGHLTVEKTGRIADLVLKSPAPVAVPAGTNEVFGPISPNRLWQSVNATADFSWSGAAMKAMYAQATGSNIDGVVALDVPAIAALLKTTGPVTVPGIPTPLTSANAAQVLLHDLYQGLPPTFSEADAARVEKLGDVAATLIDRLSKGSYDAVEIGRSLGEAAGAGHLRLWSGQASEEDTIVRAGLGGVPAAREADRTFHLGVENRTAAKLDYFVRTKLDQQLELTPSGTLIVRSTVTVDNPAPNGPVSFQLGPDPFGTATRAGDYIAWVLLWGPAGSTQDASVPESGLQLTQSVILVHPGQRQQAATITTVIPNAVHNGTVDLRYVPQPRLDAPEVMATLTAPGWHIHGLVTQSVSWDRVRHISWGVTR